MNIFGYDLNLFKQKIKPLPKSFVVPENTDGSLVMYSGGIHGHHVNFDIYAQTEWELIKHYRDMALSLEGDSIIDDIVNEAITIDPNVDMVSINLDKTKLPAGVKTKIKDAFQKILELLKFKNEGYELFRRWYVDGRLYHHIIYDETSPSKGLQELRIIDSTSIKKIKYFEKKIDDKNPGAEQITGMREVYQYRPIMPNGMLAVMPIQVPEDYISYVHSGILDKDRKMVLSYLHKAIKPLNQLRLLEDATLIYKLTRAPERRVFYIDVGNLPKGKAEQYVQNVMTKYKNKMVYDSATGEIKDQRNHMSMLEDYFLPRREGGKGTEIDTLPGGGTNLGGPEDLEYFRKRLMRALNVPLSRIENGGGLFNMGRTTEISRDEVKFTKFIQRLRRRFSLCFSNALKYELILTKVLKENDWEEIKEKIQYDFLDDAHFSELKEGELLKNRAEIVDGLDKYVGKYYSINYIRKYILRQTDEEMKEIDSDNEKDREEERIPTEQEMVAMQTGIPPQEPIDPNMMPQGQFPEDNFEPEENDAPKYTKKQ